MPKTWQEAPTKGHDLACVVECTLLSIIKFPSQWRYERHDPITNRTHSLSKGPVYTQHPRSVLWNALRFLPHPLGSVCWHRIRSREFLAACLFLIGCMSVVLRVGPLLLLWFTCLVLDQRPRVGTSNPFPGMVLCGCTSTLEFPVLSPRIAVNA